MAEQTRGEVRPAMLTPLRIALIYAVLGSLWILGSDRAVHALFNDPDYLTLAQTYKGWAYVVGSALFLYWLLVGMVRSLTRAQRELDEAYRAQKTLLNELNHRVRNNLASLSTLIDMTRRGTGNLDTFAESLQGRVSAMASAHSLLSSSNWEPQQFADLLRRLLARNEKSPIRLDGPPVTIPAPHVGPLASVLHELLANSRKYGALRDAGGVLAVTWRIHEAPYGADQLECEWTETTSAPVNPSPQRRSGLRLVEGIVRSDLRGEIAFTFTPQGARHRFALPLDIKDTAALPTVAGDGQRRP